MNLVLPLYLCAFVAAALGVRGLLQAGARAPRATRDVSLPENIVFTLPDPLAPVLGPLVARWVPVRVRGALDLLLLRAGLARSLDLHGIAAASVVWGGITLALALTFTPGPPVAWKGVLGALLGASLPVLWLRSELERRKREIARQLPFVLDLLTLAVESGLDFATALARVVPRLPEGALRTELEEFQRERPRDG